MLSELRQWIETIITPTPSEEKTEIPPTEESEEKTEIPPTQEVEESKEAPPTQEVEESKEAPPTQEADDKKDLTYFFPTKEVDVKDGMKKREPLFNFFI